MATVKPSYGSATTVPGLTLNSVASAGSATSTAIAQGTDLALDVLIQITLATASGTLGTSPQVAVYALGSLDGTTYADSTQATLLGVIPIAVAATSYTKADISLASAFGGQIPPNWKLYVVNSTGLALASSGCTAEYVEVGATVV